MSAAQQTDVQEKADKAAGKRMKIEDKLFLTRFEPDEEKHISLRNEAICSRCSDKACTYICPAEVYRMEGDKLTVAFEGCLECGSCRIACAYQNVEWSYPRGGFGIVLKFG